MGGQGKVSGHMCSVTASPLVPVLRDGAVVQDKSALPSTQGGIDPKTGMELMVTSNAVLRPRPQLQQLHPEPVCHSSEASISLR